MMIGRRSFGGSLALLLALPAWALEWSEVPTAQFLGAVRQPRTAPYWARMGGSVRRMDNKTRKTWSASLDVRMAVGQERVEAQLEFGGRERYRIRQEFATGLAGQTVREEVAPNPFGRKLAEVGVAPADLTFGFLYWDLVKEEAEDRVARRACRVLRLRHADTGEEAKVWIWTDRLAPLRVQWFRSGEARHYRELRFKGAKESKGFWLPAEIEITDGEGDWKSLVKFEDTELKATAGAAVPGDLFAGEGQDR